VPGVTPRWATAGVFFVNGAGVGTLLPQVPFLQERLALSKSVIGLCLLAMAAGALIAMPIAGQVLDRRPSRSVVRAATLAFPATLALPLLAPSPPVLAGLLFLVGAVNGTMDVAINAHGSAVERELGRPIMSWLHAAWSVGGVAGSAAAALAATAGVDPRAYVAAAALALFVAGAWLAPGIGHAAVRSEHEAGFVLPSRGVLLLGLLAVLALLSEGAMNDWSPLYLRRDLHADAGVAAAGFAAFSAGMAAARLAGDALTRRFGLERLLRGGAALAAIALAGMLAAGSVPVALAGLVLVGLGLANGVPLLISAAGRTAAPGPAIAAVSTMGYFAFLAGPPLIGILADHIGLPTALGTVCLASATVVLLGGRAGHEDRARERASA
jgi:predicted MFS family arabinose efflux permease